jgi:hypothetical protein
MRSTSGRPTVLGTGLEVTSNAEGRAERTTCVRACVPLISGLIGLVLSFREV